MIIYGNGGRPFDRCDDYDPLRSSIGVGPQGDGIDVRVVEDDPYGYYRLQFLNSNTGEVLTTTPNLDPGSRFFLCTADLQTTTMSTREFTAGSGTFTTMQALTIQDARVGDLVIYDVSRLMSDDADRYHDFLGFGVITSINNDPDAGMLITFNEVMEFDTTMNIENLSIPTSKLENGAVTSEKLANGSVGWVKLADGAVNTDKLADGAVTTDKIANNAVTTTKLSNDVLDSIAEEIGYPLDFTSIKSGISSGVYNVQTNTLNTASANYKHIEYVLDGESWIVITGCSYSNNYPAVIFFDESGNIIDVSLVSAQETTYKRVGVKVPFGAYRVIVNGNVMPSGEAAYQPHLALETRANTVRNSLENVAPQFIKFGVQELNGSITDNSIRQVTGDKSVNYADYATFSVEGGEIVYIVGWSFGLNYPAFLIYDGDNNLIYRHITQSSTGKAIKKIISLPDDAVTLVVNGNKDPNGFTYPSAKSLTFDGENLFDLYNQIKTKRRYLFIGDSYCEGYSHDGNNSGWARYCAEYLGLSQDEYELGYRGGAGFVNQYNSFTGLLTEHSTHPNDWFTDIVVCGGYNDRLQTESAIFSAIQLFVSRANSYFPYARIHVGFIAWNKEGNGDGAVQNWQEIHQSITETVMPAYKKCIAYGAHYMTNVEYWLNDSLMTNSDGYHPSESGNRSIGRAVAYALMNNDTAPIPYKESLRV